MLNLQALRLGVRCYDNSGIIIAKDTCMGLRDTRYKSNSMFVFTS